LVYYGRAESLEGDNFFALFGLADCHRGRGDNEQALRSWQRILDKDPHDKIILTRAGDALARLGRTEEAETYYRQALEEQFDAFALLGLAQIQRERGATDAAIESLTRLLAQEPRNTRGVCDLARVYDAGGERQRAKTLLEDFLARGGRGRYLTDLLRELS
jgi:tetratricopeptide (TPR) repeat protein